MPSSTPQKKPKRRDSRPAVATGSHAAYIEAADKVANAQIRGASTSGPLEELVRLYKERAGA